MARRNAPSSRVRDVRNVLSTGTPLTYRSTPFTCGFSKNVSAIYIQIDIQIQSSFTFKQAFDTLVLNLLLSTCFRNPHFIGVGNSGGLLFRLSPLQLAGAIGKASGFNLLTKKILGDSTK